MRLQISPDGGHVHGAWLRAVRILLKSTFVLGLALVLFPAISAWRGSGFVAEAVQPPTVVVKAENKTRDYGAANPALTVTYSGFINGDDEGDLFGTLTCTTTAIASSPPGNYPITCSGLVHAYYLIIYEAGTLTVNQVPLIVTVDDKGKTYGTPNPAFTASYSGFVLNQDASVLLGSLSFVTPATDSSPVGSYPITPAGLTSTNYMIRFRPGTLTVSQTPLSVKADDKTRTYGSANPAFTANYTGFVLGEDPSVLGGTLLFATNAVDASPVGSYKITTSGLTSANYQISYDDYDMAHAAGMLTVTKAPLTVKADDKTRTYGEVNPAFTSSISGFVLNQDASVLGGTLGYMTAASISSGVGGYPVTPSGLTSNNYSFSYAPGTLTILARPVTVTADNKTKLHGAVDPALTYTITSGTLVNGDSLSGNLTRAAGEAVGVYAITQGSLAAGSNYSLTYAPGTLTITDGPAANQPPVAVDDAAQTPPGVPVTVSVLANDSDPEGDPLTVTQATTADGTAIINGDGTITFTPSDGVQGTATILYVISDGKGGSDSATVLITIPAPLLGRLDVTVQMVTGTPLSAVPLQLINQAGQTVSTGATDTAGHYSFLNLPGGPIEVRATTTQAGIISAQATVVVGQTVHALLQVKAPSNLAVSPSPQSIPGDGKATSRITAVLTDYAGVPVPGVLVSFQTSAGVLLTATATTDAVGRAEVDLQSELLTDLVARDAVIIAQATDPWGYKVEAQTMVTFVPDAKPGTGTVPAAITGVVTDRTTGKPVPGATVEVNEDFDGDGAVDFAASTTTDQDGRYVISVPRGNWEYTTIIRAPLQVDDRTIAVRSIQKTQVGAVEALTANVDGEKMVSGQLFVTSPADGQAVTPAQFFGNATVSGLLRPADGSAGERPFTIAPDGSFAVDTVPIGQYTLLFRIEQPDTQRLAGVTIPVTVEQNGEINLILGLIDPYGMVTDAVTGKVIKGANMQLFWADTPLNRSHGRVPHTLVQLPELTEFPPNQNHVPQPSNADGQYAWMVWADGDYYIFAAAVGYETYDSRVEGRTVPARSGEDSYITDGIIHVGEAVVKYDLKMQPLEAHGAYVKGYPDRTFRPEGLITRAEIAAIFARLSAPKRPAAFGIGFADVPDGHWANEYTRLVKQLGLMAGDNGGIFRPQAPITRAEIAQIVQRFGRLTAEAETPKDAVGHWAEQAIRRTIASGVMVGYPDGTFRPNQNLTRAEAVTTINRLVGRKPLRSDRPQSWPDAPATHWALAEIEEASHGHRFARNNDGTERFLNALDLPTW